jgi:hypothetical protein
MLGWGCCCSSHSTILSLSGSQKSPSLTSGTLPPDFSASLCRWWQQQHGQGRTRWSDEMLALPQALSQCSGGLIGTTCAAGHGYRCCSTFALPELGLAGAAWGWQQDMRAGCGTSPINT